MLNKTYNSTLLCEGDGLKDFSFKRQKNYFHEIFTLQNSTFLPKRRSKSLYGDDNGIFVSEQGRWPYSAFVRSEAMTATFVWQKISRHILYSFFFFFLPHCSEVALVLYIWHLVTVTLIWFDFYLTTEPMSICRHVGELAPYILPPDLDIQLLSNFYLIKVIVVALWFLFLAFVLQCYQLWSIHEYIVLVTYLMVMKVLNV